MLIYIHILYHAYVYAFVYKNEIIAYDFLNMSGKLILQYGENS